MKQPVSPGKQRLVAGAADLLSRRGVQGLSIRDLATHAGAPLGSTYHHFPGGKQQLIAQAIEFAGREIALRLATALQLGPLEGLRAFLAWWRKRLLSSDFKAGCPLLPVATREPANAVESNALAGAAAEFRRWAGLLSESLKEAGVPASESEELAVLIVASIEGAVAMCRAHRSSRPLDEVAHQLEKLLASALVFSES